MGNCRYPRPLGCGVSAPVRSAHGVSAGGGSCRGGLPFCPPRGSASGGNGGGGGGGGGGGSSSTNDGDKRRWRRRQAQQPQRRVAQASRGHLGTSRRAPPRPALRCATRARWVRARVGRPPVGAISVRKTVVADAVGCRANDGGEERRSHGRLVAGTMAVLAETVGGGRRQPLLGGCFPRRGSPRHPSQRPRSATVAGVPRAPSGPPPTDTAVPPTVATTAATTPTPRRTCH